MMALTIAGIAFGLFLSFLLGYRFGYQRGAKEREQIFKNVREIQAENFKKANEGNDLAAIWRNLALGRFQKPAK